MSDPTSQTEQEGTPVTDDPPTTPHSPPTGERKASQATRKRAQKGLPAQQDDVPAVPTTDLPHDQGDNWPVLTRESDLSKLMAPFPSEAVSKLPKVTCRACTQAPRKNCDEHDMIWDCPECHGRHSEKAIHLDYVGHADVTRRLLEVDEDWAWEPFALDQYGLPLITPDGLWIRLTVCGVTRIGFGDADGKRGGSALKEMIGDAIRNAAMRFGVALDLWSKSDAARMRVEGIDPTPERVDDKAALRHPGASGLPDKAEILAYITYAAAILDKSIEELTLKMRTRLGGEAGPVAVDNVPNLSNLDLLMFATNLVPYVRRVEKHQATVEAAIKSPTPASVQEAHDAGQERAEADYPNPEPGDDNFSGPAPGPQGPDPWASDNPEPGADGTGSD